MSRSVVTTGIIIIILAVGAWFVVGKSNTNKANNNASNQSQAASSASGSQTAADTITYDGNSFSPNALTVKSGTSVTIKNTSSEQVQVQSNPHPTHTDDPDLNVGLIDPGKSKTFTVTQKGTFGYHNHLDPSQQGAIAVE